MDIHFKLILSQQCPVYRIPMFGKVWCFCFWNLFQVSTWMLYFKKNPTNRVYSTLPSILSLVAFGIWRFWQSSWGHIRKTPCLLFILFLLLLFTFLQNSRKSKKKESLLLFKLLGRLAKKVSHVPKVDHLEKHRYLEKYAYILKCMHISQKVVLIHNQQCNYARHE